MSAYQLTRQETWVFTTLFNLPIQPGSALGEWLGNQDVPSIEEIESWIPQAIKTLDKKGYTDSKIENKSHHDTHNQRPTDITVQSFH